MHTTFWGAQKDGQSQEWSLNLPSVKLLSAFVNDSILQIRRRSFGRETFLFMAEARKLLALNHSYIGKFLLGNGMKEEEKKWRKTEDI